MTLTGIKIMYQILETHHSSRHSEFYKIMRILLGMSGRRQLFINATFNTGIYLLHIASINCHFYSLNV